MPEQEADMPSPARIGFAPGVSGNPGGKPKKSHKSTRPAPPLLVNMRRVASGASCGPDGKKQTILQKQLAAWLERDPKGFFAKLVSLEAAFLTSLGPGKKPGPQPKAAAESAGRPEEAAKVEEPAQDVGVERVEELIKRLLGEAAG